MSLPTRECGLKSMLLVEVSPSIDVTPYAGVWIEIANEEVQKISIAVTPYAGVWIEIKWNFVCHLQVYSSLPTRECGLKLFHLQTARLLCLVTPYAGVWIEIICWQRIKA